MQTFIPYGSDFSATAKCLDRQRLGKQRVETYQILRSLAGKIKGWHSHPAVKMWRGYEEALVAYGLAICDEWIARGYRDTCREKILAFAPHVTGDDFELPWWIDDDEVVLSHRSNLIRKMPEHYSMMWPATDDSRPYVWPEGKTLFV
jgi:hypothetical protein